MLKLKFLFVAFVAALHVQTPEALANCGGGIPCGGVVMGGHATVNVGVGVGAPVPPPMVPPPAVAPVPMPVPMGRPMYYGPYGVYPKVLFPAPLRRSLGLPGFTPVRQFLFGRGAIRRQSRRACFGRRFCC